jgi:glycosyltransferase involved in cell wall biosynthesis
MIPQEDIRVTYLITTRNRGKFLKETLANVREFITPEDELVIIDGLSTDDTGEVVENNKDIVKTFLSEKDFGEAHAFNKGLFRARGRYIKPITDDDYYYPASMRQLVQEMERNPDLDAIQCGGENWKLENGQMVFIGARCVPPQITATPEAIFDFAFSGQGLIIRRSALERIGGVNSSCVSVDGELMVKLIECRCRIRYLDLKLFKWTWYPHSGMNRQSELESDLLKFNVHLGRWDRIFSFSYEPETLVKLMDYKDKPGGLNQMYGIWAVGFVARSKFGFTLRLFAKLIRAAVMAKIRLQQSAMWCWRHGASRSEGSIGTHQWSGMLR